MKSQTPPLVAALALFALAANPSLRAETLSRPPLPELRIEDVELPGGATYRSLVFQAALGMEYVVQSSEDLVTWENLPDRHYGLNHDVVVPMIEKLEPGSPPQGPPSGPPPAPVKTATLILHRADGGGVILSFRSLDGGQPLRYHSEELSMSAEWDSIPLYVNRFDNHMFCILHSGTEMEPDEENPPLGPEDEAMVEDFEEHFATMDAEVVASVIRTRTMPDPPAQAPGERLFLRVAALEADTDADGTPDWMEFAQAGNENPGEPPADPWNADADGNGIPDGQERDSDGDGVPDALDAAPDNKLIDWEKTGYFQFAWFPVENEIDGPVAPIQVNDQGVVLFSKAIWRNGEALPLHPGPGGAGNVWGAAPLGLGDNGAILGKGMVGDYSRLVTWPANGGQPIALKAGDADLEPARIPIGDPPAGGEVMPPSDMIVNKDGVFIGMKLHEEEFYQWKLEAGVAEVTGEGQVPAGTAWVADDGTLCGRDPDGKFTAGSETFDKHYTRATLTPGPRLGVFAGYKENPFAYENKANRIPQILDSSTWEPCKPLEDYVDFSAAGRFGIGRSYWTWNDNRTHKIHEQSPGLKELSADWSDPLKCKYIDTTRHGWTLAIREDGEAIRAILGAPLFQSMQEHGRGLDPFSASATRLATNSPAEIAAMKDEFWVMIPANGQVTFKVRSPANPVTPLKVGGGGTAANPAAIVEQEKEITLTAPGAAAGSEVAVPFKIDDLEAVTVPLKAKIMKPRVVNVSVYPLKRPGQPVGNPPANLPPLPVKADIEAHLNDIFQPQINVTFNVTIQQEETLAEDPGSHFNVTDPPSGAQLALATGRQAGNIRVYVMGGYHEVFSPGDGFPFYGAWTDPEGARIWMSIGSLISGNEDGKKLWLTTLAHEIGHVFLGRGHPDNSAHPGVAPLPNTPDEIKQRLMHSGSPLTPLSPAERRNRRVLVKGEWDEAESWLIDNIDP